MKNIMVAMTLAALLTGITSVKAQDSSPLEKILLFGAGYLTGHVVHEMGHVAMSQMTGVPMRFIWIPNQWPPIQESITVFPTMNKARIITVNEGGFVAEIAASEVILSTTNKLDVNRDYDCYLLGVLGEAIINPLAYTLIDRLTPGGWGDLQCIQELGGNKTNVEMMIVAHSVLTFARVMFKLDNSRTIELSSTPTSISLSVNF